MILNISGPPQDEKLTTVTPFRSSKELYPTLLCSGIMTYLTVIVYLWRHISAFSIAAPLRTVLLPTYIFMYYTYNLNISVIVRETCRNASFSSFFLVVSLCVFNSTVLIFSFIPQALGVTRTDSQQTAGKCFQSRRNREDICDHVFDLSQWPCGAQHKTSWKEIFVLKGLWFPGCCSRNCRLVFLQQASSQC